MCVLAGDGETRGVGTCHGSGSGIEITGRSRSTSFCMAITGDCIGGGILGSTAAFGIGFGSGGRVGSREGFGSGGCAGDCASGCAGECGFGREVVGIGVVAVTGAGLALAAGISRAFL